MNRRKALRILSTLAVGGVLLPTGMYLVSPGTKKYAEDTIFSTLSYLQLDKQGVRNFVNDYFKGGDIGLKTNLRWKAYFFSGTGVTRSDNLFELVRSYLLSSDFFINGTDISKTVNYLSMFNPYKSSMPNPYSYIYLPQ